MPGHEIMIEKPRSGMTCLLVLGMHRSGTSALAGVLAKSGCATPTALAPADENNANGYFESIPIWRLSEDILDAAGSSWDDWIPIDLSRVNAKDMARFGERAQFLLRREYPDAQRFVLKDPRMCRLLPFWLEQIEAYGATPHLVLTHRHPDEVAKSLKRRNGLHEDFSRLIWLRYVLEAEHKTRGRPRVFASYDRLLSDWRQVTSRIGATHKIDLDADAGAIDGFLSGELRHFQMSKGDALSDHPWLGPVFEVFERWAETGEDAADMPGLDAVRHALDAACASLGRLSAAAKLTEPDAACPEEAGSGAAGLKAGLDEARADMRLLRQSLAAQDLELARMTQDLQARSSELAVLRNDLAVSEQRVVGILRERDGFQAAADQARRKNKDLQVALDHLQDELKKRAAKLDSLKEHIKALEYASALTQESSSWRMTAPFRRLARLLRGDPS